MADTDKPGLAKNSFLTAADNTLATVDAYAKKQVTNAQATINNAKSQYDAAAAKYEDKIRQGRDAKAKVDAAKSWVKTGRDILSSKDGLARIQSVSTHIQAGLKSAGLETELSNRVFGLVSTTSKVNVDINGTISKIKSRDIPRLKKLLSVINKLLSKESTTTDTATKIGTAAALMIAALEIGTEGSWAIATNTFGNDTSSLKKVAKLVLPTVIKKTAAGTLLDMATTLGDKILLTINSLVIREFCKSFSVPSNVTDEYAFYVKVVKAFDATDSAWRYFNTTSLNVLPLVYGSDSCKTFFIKYGRFEDSADKRMLLLGTLFKVVAVKDTLSSNFSGLVISTDQVTT